MLILGILLIAFGASMAWFIATDNDLGILGMIISGVLLLVVLISLPTNRMGVHANILAFHALEATAEAARESGSGMEMAAYQMKVAESNQWLARVKYWNGTIFDIWTPDAVEDLEPIR